MTRIDLTGDRYGRLIVRDIASSSKGIVRWNCVCDCGRRVVVCGNNLKSGNTKSCGCLAREWRARGFAQATTIHGQTRGEHERTYRIWHNMKNRCENPNFDSFPWYGGRGIKVCEAWKEFSNFFKDMGAAPADMSLDRIDSDGDYEKENCRWATKRQQARNKRNTRMISWRGQSKSLAEWAEITGILQPTISRRIDTYGWPVERALTEPPHKASRRISL